MIPSSRLLILSSVLCLLSGAGVAATASEAASAPAAAAPSAPPAQATVQPIGKGALTMEDLRQKLSDRIDEVKARQDKPPAAAKSVAPSGASPQATRVAAVNRAQKVGAPVAVSPLEALSHAHPAHPAHWSYVGDDGPADWSRLRPEFATCATGQRQSPIDIRDGIRVDLEPIVFDYRPTGFNVVDNGHTVQANLGGGNAIVVNQRRYELVQFHFHRPSEERINGRQYDMSVHLVHKDPEGRLAVLAVLVERGGAHPVVQQVWNSLPLEKHDTLTGPAPLDPSLLLPEDRRYFTYMGSLTTPPCSEGVLWLVMKQPVSLSDQQLAVFARLYPMNARPLQSSAGRLIKESN